MPPGEGTHRRIHEAVSRIPRGRVATYGQIARVAKLPGQARLVGYAMHALPRGSTVPWQRVVNAQGAISVGGESGVRQRHLLEKEGVEFDARGRISLTRFQWRPDSTRAQTKK
ncbi:MAG TPA: MGMT family protein [Gemmatimonadaceae bacterium]|jgi:methylated-DNA-protein-cysteine methyltransferase-like protein